MSDCGEEKAAIEEEDGIPTNQPPSIDGERKLVYGSEPAS
jgi:hypothetical protein